MFKNHFVSVWSFFLKDWKGFKFFSRSVFSDVVNIHILKNTILLIGYDIMCRKKHVSCTTGSLKNNLTLSVSISWPASRVVSFTCRSRVATCEACVPVPLRTFYTAETETGSVFFFRTRVHTSKGHYRQELFWAMVITAFSCTLWPYVFLRLVRNTVYRRLPAGLQKRM